MSVLDDAFQSLVDCIERILPTAATELGLAEYLSEQAVGKAEILREECRRLEERINAHVTTDVAMGSSVRMSLAYAIALSKLEMAAKSAVGEGSITEGLRGAVQALEELSQAAGADAN